MCASLVTLQIYGTRGNNTLYLGYELNSYLDNDLPKTYFYLEIG